MNNRMRGRREGGEENTDWANVTETKNKQNVVGKKGKKCHEKKNPEDRQKLRIRGEGEKAATDCANVTENKNRQNIVENWRRKNVPEKSP